MANYVNTKNAIMEVCAQYQRLTDRALEAAKIARDDGLLEDEAVNWADLSCVNAEYFCDMYGEQGWRVYIAEAKPESRALADFVRRRFIDRFALDPPEVVTEW